MTTSYQTPAEMRKEFMRSDASKQEFCGNEDHECQCDVNRDKIADFWLSKLQAREEWLKKVLWSARQGLTNSALLEEHSMDRCDGLKQGIEAFDDVLSLITKK